VETLRKSTMDAGNSTPSNDLHNFVNLLLFNFTPGENEATSPRNENPQ